MIFRGHGGAHKNWARGGKELTESYRNVKNGNVREETVQSWSGRVADEESDPSTELSLSPEPPCFALFV